MDAFMNKLKVELIVIIKKGGTNYQLKKKWGIKNRQKWKRKNGTEC